MNLEGASVERLLGRNIMPRFHAAFSGAPSSAPSSVRSWLATRAGDRAPAGGRRADHRWLPVGDPLFLPRLESEDEAAALEGACEPAATPGPARLGVLSAWTEPRTLLIGP